MIGDAFLIVTDSNDVQFKNANTPISSTDCGIVICCKFLHSAKAYWSMVIRWGGRVISFIEELLNVSCSIDTRLSGSITVFNAEHSLNVDELVAFSFEDNWTFSKYLLLKNTEGPNLSTDSGMMYSFAFSPER